MAATCDLSGLPSDHSKEVISDIILKNNLKNVEAVITSGSEKGDNFAGEMLRIKITGTKENEVVETIHLIMKVSPTNEYLRSAILINKLYMREAYSYKVLLPYFNKLQDEYRIPQKDRFNFAKCYKASSEEHKELIVMEDLSVKGFEMFDRLKSFDSAHLNLSVKNLAVIHAFSFVMKRKDPELFSEMASNTNNGVDHFKESFQSLIKRSFTETLKIIDDEVCKEKLRQFSIIQYKKLANVLDSTLVAPYNVICHGDSWPNNLLFKYEGNTPVDMRTIDWQVIRNASPIIDLSYLIFLSTDEQTREENCPAIFDFYYSTLRSRLAAMDHDVEECYPENVYRDHLKTIMPYGLIFALLALPITLSERGNAPNLLDMLGHEHKAAEKCHMSQICVKRINGIVKYFVEHNLI